MYLDCFGPNNFGLGIIWSFHLVQRFSNSEARPSRGMRCNSRGGAHDPGEQAYIYKFIDNGLIYSEWGARKSFSLSIWGLLKNN